MAKFDMTSGEGTEVTEEEARQVKGFLYSIRRAEQAAANLERALEDLDTRRASPPDGMSDLTAERVSGGLGGSRLENWTEFLEAYPAQRAYLADQLARRRREIGGYRQALEFMAGEPRWGALGARIIRLKYYERVTPDRAIYAGQLFCAERTYYHAHRRALQLFCDLLPDLFGQRRAS